jgi:hypothetical protein
MHGLSVRGKVGLKRVMRLSDELMHAHLL